MSIIQINSIQINRKITTSKQFALFQLGFRPFFLGATLFAPLSILLWYLIYFSHINSPNNNFTPFQWHSHEMIYGYSMAVIAGFLLTAVMNWTGIQTLQNKSLFLLFALWSSARVAFLFGNSLLLISATFDILFMLYLFYAVSSPILESKQYKQLGILAKILLLLIGNFSFYLGAFGIIENGVYWGIYGGLYLIISLILTIGSRVVPAFIRNGLDLEASIKNPLWMAILNLALFLFFTINQLFLHSSIILGYISIFLFIINSWRLYLWHVKGIWHQPLLWSLYLAFVFIDLGFLLFALSVYLGSSEFLGVHAFAFGGIGLATLSMMSRVTLGHTGRDIKTPPYLTFHMFILLTLGAITRVIMPLFDLFHYSYWVLTSQILWIAAFILFLAVYSKMLILPRQDGLAG